MGNVLVTVSASGSPFAPGHRLSSIVREDPCAGAVDVEDEEVEDTLDVLTIDELEELVAAVEDIEIGEEELVDIEETTELEVVVVELDFDIET